MFGKLVQRLEEQLDKEAVQPKEEGAQWAHSAPEKVEDRRMQKEDKKQDRRNTKWNITRPF